MTYHADFRAFTSKLLSATSLHACNAGSPIAKFQNEAGTAESLAILPLKPQRQQGITEDQHKRGPECPASGESAGKQIRTPSHAPKQVIHIMT